MTRLLTAAWMAFAASAAFAQTSGSTEQSDGFTEEEQISRIANKVAVFAGLDKITGRITEFDVYIDETVKFGQLELTPRACYSSSAAETPKTTSFIEVDEITLDRRIRRIFNGWMFAESPGLNAIEHPVNDVWLKACKQVSDVPPPPSTN